MRKFAVLFSFLFITSIALSQDNTSANTQKDKTAKDGGYSSINEVGALFGFAQNQGGRQHSYEEIYFSLKSTHGYRFNKHYFLGGGAGIDVTKGKEIPHWGSNKILMMPLFAEFRATIRPRKVSPFISQQLGYAFHFVFPKPDVYSKLNGGAMAATQIGLSVRVAKNLLYNFSAGYRLQHVVVRWDFTGLQWGSQWNGGSYYPLLPTNEPNLPKQTHYFYHYATILTGLTF